MGPKRGWLVNADLFSEEITIHTLAAKLTRHALELQTRAAGRTPVTAQIVLVWRCQEILDDLLAHLDRPGDQASSS